MARGDDTERRSASGAPIRLGRWLVLVAKHSWRRMREHNASETAASLCYQTIFALVPALVLAFLILKSAGVMEDGKKSLRSVLETAGLTQISIRTEQFDPNSEEEDSQPDGAAVESNAPVFNLAKQIEEAVDGVEKEMTFSRLGPVGMVLLAWSAISLLTTIERALNRIFEAPSSRALARRVLLYWSAVTFLPLVGLTLGYLATTAARYVSGNATLAGLVVVLDIFANLGLGILALACIYRFLPNTAVTARSALIGAAVVVPLWIAARWGFALYISLFVVRGRGSVYGALGLLPLFLIWINLCWYALLYGAEVAHAAGHLRHLEAEKDAARLPLGGAEALSAALVVGGAYLLHKRPASFAEILEALGLPEPAVRRLLDRLTQGGIVAPVAAGGAASGSVASGPEGAGSEVEAYLPARPLESVPAREVLALGSPGDESRADEKTTRALRQVRDKTDKALGEVTLGDLLRE